MRLEIESAMNDDPLLDPQLLAELEGDGRERKPTTATVMDLSLFCKQVGPTFQY